MFGLSLNETLTLTIAAYAAVVSTFILGWDAYKWLNEGPDVRIDATTGMKLIGSPLPDPATYISVKAVNVGDRATTITNLGYLYYKSWWKAYLRKKSYDATFIIPRPSEAQRLPYKFEVGDQWLGICVQDEDVDKMIQEGYLFVVLYCSTSRKGVRYLLNRKEHKTVQQANQDA